MDDKKVKPEIVEPEITQLVEHKGGDGISLRMVLIYILLLASGLFLGILFGYLLRS